jgi:hypothetical protein
MATGAMNERMRNNVILEGKTRIGKHWVEANGKEHFIQKIFPCKKEPMFMAVSIETKERQVIYTENDNNFNVKYL